MYKPELRIKWDTSAKHIKFIEGDDISYVVHTHMLSPVFFISERDIVDKRCEFFHNGLFYSLFTGVNDNYFPSQANVIRCKTLLNLSIISQDEDYYYFISFNQLDLKVIKFN